MKRPLVLLGALFVLWPASPLPAIEYTGKSLRDPFSDKNAGAATAQVISTAQASQISSVDLQGIVLSPGKPPRAIIDGAIVTVGSSVKMGQVKNITKEGVTITYNAQDYFLPDKGRTFYEKARAVKIQAKQF